MSAAAKAAVLNPRDTGAGLDLSHALRAREGTHVGELALPYITIDPNLREHPRFRRLAVELRSPDRALVLLVRLWMFCGQQFPSGSLAGLSDAEIERAMGWLATPGRGVGALVACGWLEGGAEGARRVHAWGSWGGRALRARISRRVLFEKTSKKQHQKRKQDLDNDNDNDHDNDHDGDVDGDDEVLRSAPPTLPDGLSGKMNGKANPGPKEKKPDPVSLWMESARQEALRLTGQPFPVDNWGRDRKLLAALVGQLDAENLLERWRMFLRDSDPFVARNRTFRFFATRASTYVPEVVSPLMRVPRDQRGLYRITEDGKIRHFQTGEEYHAGTA